MNMKTLLLTTTAILMTTSAFAQDCKYQKVVTQKSGEIVTSTTDYNCETKPKVIYKEIEKPVYIYRDSTPIVTESIVYSEPIYQQPKRSVINSIVSTLINSGINVNALPAFNIGNNVTVTLFEETDPYWKENNQNCVYKKPSPGSQFTLRQCN